jgi:cold shock CspA family protein
MRERGTVKFWNYEKGYGFAIPDLGGQDVHLSQKQLRADGTLEKEMRVEFELMTDHARGRCWARNITLVGNDGR